jgi:hypothetical protein
MTVGILFLIIGAIVFVFLKMKILHKLHSITTITTLITPPLATTRLNMKRVRLLRNM